RRSPGCCPVSPCPSPPPGHGAVMRSTTTGPDGARRKTGRGAGMSPPGRHLRARDRPGACGGRGGGPPAEGGPPPPARPAPRPPHVPRRQADVSFPARVRAGKVYLLRVQIVPSEEVLPTGEVRQLPRPHAHDVDMALAAPPQGEPLRVTVSVAAENFEVEGSA